MLSFFKNVFFIILISALTSCSLFRNNPYLENRDTDYLKAYSVPPLVIPPGLSSSTIKAHFPVTGKNYPPCLQRVNLTPPELVNYVPAPRRMVAEAVAPEPVPVSRPIMSVSVPFTRPPHTEPVMAKNQNPNQSYYDNFTRSSSNSSNKSGVPLSSVWHGNAAKPNAVSSVNTAPVTGSKTADSTTQNTGSSTPVSTNNTQQNSIQNTIINKLSSLWPWGDNKQPSPATDATQTTKTKQDSSVKQAENNSQEPDVKKQYYFDNFTHR